VRQGALGWGLLAVVLAIPAFLFYRWKTGMQNTQAAAISEIARGRISSGDLFGKSPEQTKFQNPLDSSGGRAAAPGAKANEPLSGGAARASRPGATIASPAPVAVKKIAAPAAPVASAIFQSSDTAPATYEIQVARDPTLSPADLSELRRIRLERAREEWLRLHPPKRKKIKIYRPPIESTVHLEGIVYVPGNSMAIVNNNMTLKEGDHIGKIRVIKINRNSVIFGYENKTFVKAMGK